MWQNIPPALSTPGEFSVTYILRELYPGCHPTNLIRIQMPSRGISRYRDCERLRTFSNVLEIDADGNHLPLDVFSNFPALETLSLCANNIDCLRREEYHFPLLRNLDLSFNRLQPHDLPKLGGLKVLRELTLSRNRIRFLTKEFSAQGNFPSLQILRLDQNCLRFQNTFFILSKLPKLTTLVLDNNHFQEIPYLLFMSSNDDYENMIVNSLRLLQSYGNFLQKHHLQHLNRKLYQHETKISACSFTTLETNTLQSAKTSWTNRHRQIRSSFKVKNIEAEKKTQKNIFGENIKPKSSQLSVKNNQVSNESQKLNTFEKNFLIFNGLMECKWDNDKNDNKKESKITIVDTDADDDDDDDDDDNEATTANSILDEISKKASSNSSLKSKKASNLTLKENKSSTIMVKEKKSNDQTEIVRKDFKVRPDDDKVDRSIYELQHVPFPCLERLALRRCEIARQVTILASVLWPALSHIDLTGNRLFDQTCHPGNVRAIMKFFSKAGVAIQTGYQINCLVKPDQDLINATINESRSANQDHINNIYSSILNQQPTTVQAYWKQVIEQRGRPVQSQLINSPEILPKKQKTPDGQIDLQLGEGPPIFDLKSEISQTQTQRLQRQGQDVPFRSALPIIQGLGEINRVSEFRYKESSSNRSTRKDSIYSGFIPRPSPLAPQENKKYSK